jgi:hypothetical protein
MLTYRHLCAAQTRRTHSAMKGLLPMRASPLRSITCSTHTMQPHTGRTQLRIGVIACALALALMGRTAWAQDLPTPTPAPAGAAPATAAPADSLSPDTIITSAEGDVLRTTRLSGTLPNKFSAHYLGLRPVLRDQRVNLTLAFDPQTEEAFGLVNFVVLTDDGLRRFLAGEDPLNLDIASGNDIALTAQRNDLQASFSPTNAGGYTVIVYSRADVPVNYTLTAQNAVLFDDASQVQARAGDIVTPTPAPTPVPLGAASVVGRRLSGSLDGDFERHYIMVAPEIVDGQVQLRMEYAPLDRPELAGKMSFWVLDDEGVRRLVRGDAPADINLATGFASPFANFGELLASFKATGDTDYTAVIFNESGVPATYALNANGALLVDNYGQTNEAVGAAAEQAALAAASAPTPTPEPPVAIDVNTDELPVVRPAAVQGALTTPYAQNYLGLTPNVSGGNVTLLLDVNPKDNEALQGNVNLWVLDADGLRRVIAGTPPDQLSLASGARVESGPNEGKYRADFTPVGRNPYTVIVFNATEIPATYTLQVIGGGLEDTLGQTTPLP